MRRSLVALALAATALMLVACGTVVPDLKGMTAVQARGEIELSGFTLGRIDYDDSAAGARGGVVSQVPEAGRRGQAGMPVNVVIAGPPPVDVPNLARLDLAGARVALSAAGLAAGAVEATYTSEVPRGELVTQTPAPGAQALKGSAVALVFSDGPAPIAVPTLTGLTEKEAASRLQVLGFAVKVTQVYSSKAKGRVVAQNPAGGEMQPGQPITLSVSKGPEPRADSSGPTRYAGEVNGWFGGIGSGWANVTVGGQEQRVRCDYRVGAGDRVWVMRGIDGIFFVSGLR